MGIFDLFSKRQKRLRGEVPDVFVYDEIPEKLRVQIAHIIRDALGLDQYGQNVSSGAYKFIHETLCREYGLFKLTSGNTNDFTKSVFDFFLDTKSHEEALDVIELTFHTIDGCIRTYSYQDRTDVELTPDEAIVELNLRFREHGVGYQFESGELIRVDSQFMHSEVVKPTLSILKGKIYKGANDEFLKAHEHYRYGRHKECLNDSLKAFESVMKAICIKHRWKFEERSTAKKLIEICLEKGLIPSYLQSQFTSLRSVLESGVPTVRNKLGGHGQGADIKKVSEEMARYALNLAASNILFLAEHEKNI
jgi:hypothetical protein